MKGKGIFLFPGGEAGTEWSAVGSKIMTPEDQYIAEFEVMYEPGELKALGVDGDKNRDCFTLHGKRGKSADP